MVPSLLPAGRSTAGRATDFAKAVGSSTALLYLIKALLNCVRSPSPNVVTSVAMFAALTHQIVLYHAARAFSGAPAGSPGKLALMIPLIFLSALSCVLAYWSLTVLSVAGFQLLMLVSVPATALLQRMETGAGCSTKQTLVAGSLLLVGVSAAFADSLSLLSGSLVIFNFATVIPLTLVLAERTSVHYGIWDLVLYITPWSSALVGGLWFAMETVQNSVVVYPEFWTFGVVARLLLSAAAAVAAVHYSANANPAMQSVEVQISRILVRTLAGWASTLSFRYIFGLVSILSGAAVHIRYASSSSSVPYDSPPILSTANTGKHGLSLRRVIKSRRPFAVTRFQVLGVMLVTLLLYSTFIPHSRPRSPILPFNDADFLRVEGSTRLGFDHIYVINLARRSDRRETMAARFHQLGMSVSFTPASEPGTSPAVADRLDLVHKKPLWGWWVFGTHLTKGEIALTVSQLRILRDIVDRGHEMALIMEDDVLIETDIDRIVRPFKAALPKDADLFYLGYCDNIPGERILEVGDYSLAVATHPSCAHAYAVTRKGAERMLHMFSEPGRSYDDAIVSAVDMGTLKAYSVHPPLVNQDDFTPSDLSVQSWWSPFKRTLRDFAELVRAVSNEALRDPVVVTDADVAWAVKWQRTALEARAAAQAREAARQEGAAAVAAAGQRS
ncbi:hypothetical protein HDU89_004888 [Geranomyces variabilis]|nr:hypothetical protein HDU89_004888 [Geranomyces variabilis]